MASGTNDCVVAGTWFRASVAEMEGFDEFSTLVEARLELTVDETVAEGPAERNTVEDGAEDSLSLFCRRTAW